MRRYYHDINKANNATCDTNSIMKQKQNEKKGFKTKKKLLLLLLMFKRTNEKKTKI